ncbi:MAG: nucleoside-triphosphatase [Alphaproteobacteria bacterium]|nr:nucleoside-triphosphatase [Alphaproteobacteria bacterium]
MSTQVMIALSLGAQVITGSLVNPNNYTIVESLPAIRVSSGIETDVTSMIESAKKRCFELGCDPIHVAMSTKGEVTDLGVRFSRNGHLANLSKSILGKNLLKATVLNRFHSFAMGVMYLEKPRSESFGVLNLSDGVGYGVIKKSKLWQHYDARKGCGGLEVIQRSSDRRVLPISQIASTKAVMDRARQLITPDISMADLFKTGVWDSDDAHSKNAEKIIDDIIGCVLHIAGDLVSQHNITTLYIALFPDSVIHQKDQDEFMSLLKKKSQRHDHTRIKFRLFNTDLTQEVVKQLGACYFTQQTRTTLSTYNFDQGIKIFSVTGVPTSGKSTFCAKLIEHIKTEGSLKLFYCLSKEIRDQHRKRIGFSIETSFTGQDPEILELATVSAPLAQSADYIAFSGTPYFINIKNVNKVAQTINTQAKNADVIVIDEVASMQLFSQHFKSAIEQLLKCHQIVVLTVPISSKNRLVTHIKEVSHQIQLDVQNREASQSDILRALIPHIKDSITKGAKVHGTKLCSISTALFKIYDQCVW